MDKTGQVMKPRSNSRQIEGCELCNGHRPSLTQRVDGAAHERADQHTDGCRAAGAFLFQNISIVVNGMPITRSQFSDLSFLTIVTFRLGGSVSWYLVTSTPTTA